MCEVNSNKNDPLVTTVTGGRDGRNSALTFKGKQVLRFFRKVNEKLRTIVAKSNQELPDALKPIDRRAVTKSTSREVLYKSRSQRTVSGIARPAR